MQASGFELKDAENRILGILQDNAGGVVDDSTIKELCSDLTDESRAQVINSLLVKRRIELLTT